MTRQPSSALWRFVDEDDSTALTLIVDTPAGPYTRRVPPALPLPSNVEHGPAAEEAAHRAAATWGMPDFVFQQAAHATKGSGRRELGDRLLLAGRRGAVVQVKARTIAPKPDAQEAGWIQKVAAKAMSQAKGTVRQLRMLPADMVNGRGRTLSVDGNAHEWVAVFLLDHPGVPEGTIATWQPIGTPAIALTRRDWDFLFDQLRSTTAVLDYLFRAAAEPPIPLGEEPVRYYEFAAADAAAPPLQVDTGLVGPGGVPFSTPLLPQAPAGADGTNAHLMIRIMFEDIALSTLADPLTEAHRFTMLCDLDLLPVGARAEWGQLLLDMLNDVPDVPEGYTKWRFRRMVHEDGTRQLIVGATTDFDTAARTAFAAFVQLRHHEVTSRTAHAEEFSTLGILLTPRHDGLRPWDTNTIRVHGHLDLPDDQLRLYQEAWNRTPEDGSATAVE
ncbi:hypothetical protein [Streptomyces gardneri]|uniref:hypothetical protein n=1 Tax=Streptomyces gardneri TaxID=66892 RepID=UPI0033CFFDA4